MTTRRPVRRNDKPRVPLDPCDAPMPFFGKTRLVKGGPWVPCRLWKDEDRCPETGELLSDVEYHAEVNGREVDWDRMGWPWQPITEAEFRDMLADAQWCRDWKPNHPKAQPERRVDLRKADFSDLFPE